MNKKITWLNYVHSWKMGYKEVNIIREFFAYKKTKNIIHLKRALLDLNYLISFTNPDSFQDTKINSKNKIVPQHYKQGIELIEFIEAKKLNFTEGNVIKYLTRYKFKDGLQDLEKSRWYLERMIKTHKENILKKIKTKFIFKYHYNIEIIKK